MHIRDSSNKDECTTGAESQTPSQLHKHYVENSPARYRSLRALRARSAPGDVRESVSKNRGVPESVWRSALGALLKVTEKCPKSVFLDTFKSHFGHILGRGSKDPWSTPSETPRHTRFSGTLSRALRGGLRTRRARRLL